MPKFKACSRIVIRKCLNFPYFFLLSVFFVLHVIIAPVKHGKQS